MKKKEDIVYIPRKVKVTSDVIDYIRRHSNEKPSVVKALIKEKFGKEVSASTIYKVRYGIYKALTKK